MARWNTESSSIASQSDQINDSNNGNKAHEPTFFQSREKSRGPCPTLEKTKNGDAVAQFDVRVMCDVAEKDYTNAMEWYTRAVDQGHATAQQCVGYIYNFGLGVERDFNKAAELYLKAIEQNEVVAMNRYGILWNAGSGVPQAYTETMKWYIKSTETGEGLTRNDSKALEWYLKAIAHGDSKAQFNVWKSIVYPTASN
ncbi:hypothetical protein BGZ76_002239 [Entomortierella beljakovae]|nr:hypothetical protein BGZ76_002239 [Entomortierella beljakovae]